MKSIGRFGVRASGRREHSRSGARGHGSRTQCVSALRHAGRDHRGPIMADRRRIPHWIRRHVGSVGFAGSSHAVAAHRSIRGGRRERRKLRPRPHGHDGTPRRAAMDEASGSRPDRRWSFAMPGARIAEHRLRVRHERREPAGPIDRRRRTGACRRWRLSVRSACVIARRRWRAMAFDRNIGDDPPRDRVDSSAPWRSPHPSGDFRVRCLDCSAA
jgi:hypothetical protein